MREFQDIARVVIKVGTNLLTPSALPDERRFDSLASDTAALKRRGYMPIIVSSGAIGFGARELGMASRPKKVEMKQACAAIGQPLLMSQWQNALSSHGIRAAQILLSRESFDDRKSFLNLRNAVEYLLNLDVVPIMNENDSVSTSEIGDVFGDNDSLSAHIASKLDAGLLILLTDIDALYDKNPKHFPDANPIPLVKVITQEMWASAGDAGSEHSTGGMLTKLQAVEIAARAGCKTVLADGRIPQIMLRILDGEEIGTLFLSGPRMGARMRWILSARPRGRVFIDDGALAALDQRKSLLPMGVTSVEGTFEVGEVVCIGKNHKAITLMSSEEIRSVMKLHSNKVKKILGPGRREEVAKADDIVSST